MEMNGNNIKSSDFWWEYKGGPFASWLLDINTTSNDKLVSDFIMISRKYGFILPIGFTQNVKSTIDENISFLIHRMGDFDFIKEEGIEFNSFKKLNDELSSIDKKLLINPLFALYSSKTILDPRFSSILFHFDAKGKIQNSLAHLVESLWSNYPYKSCSLSINNIIRVSCICNSPIAIKIESDVFFQN